MLPVDADTLGFRPPFLLCQPNRNSLMMLLMMRVIFNQISMNFMMFMLVRLWPTQLLLEPLHLDVVLNGRCDWLHALYVLSFAAIKCLDIGCVLLTLKHSTPSHSSVTATASAPARSLLMMLLP